MTDESDGASAMAKARWAKASKEERSEHAKKMNAARWAGKKKVTKEAAKKGKG